jgi:tryptophan-rich sensory protein
LFGLAANLPSRAAFSAGEDARFYEGQRQAPFAPLSWVFGPAWAINNVSVLWGNLRLVNLPEDAPNKQALLKLQGASWLLYSTFAYVYFRKKSPILAFVWTGTFWVLTVASIVLSLGSERKIAASFGTLIAWLTLATPVAAYQAANNPDPLLGYDPRRRRG